MPTDRWKIVVFMRESVISKSNLVNFTLLFDIRIQRFKVSIQIHGLTSSKEKFVNFKYFYINLFQNQHDHTLDTFHQVPIFFLYGIPINGML